MKKLLYIGILVSLLQSCSLFVKTPQGVVEGQRAVYQSVIINQESTNTIIDTYVRDCKKLITYHASYVFQLKLMEIERKGEPENSWGPSKSDQKIAAELNKEAEVKRAFDAVENRADKMREETKKHHGISLKLIGAIYDYLSTSPIEVDNLEFWVNKLNKIEEAKDE